MLKKILIVIGLLVVGSWVIGKTDLGSYVKTGWKEFWASTKKAVPVGFEIKRAEEMLANLDKADDRLIAAIASETVAIGRLEKEVSQLQASTDKLREEILARNEQLKTGAAVHKFGSQEYTSTQLAKELERSFKRLKTHEATLQAKKELLAERKQRLDAAKEQRDALMAEKADLQARIEKLKTDLAVLKAAETRSKKACSDSQLGELAKLKELVDSLEQRIETNMIEVQIREESRSPAPVFPIQEGGNITREIDEYFSKTKVAKD